MIREMLIVDGEPPDWAHSPHHICGEVFGLFRLHGNLPALCPSDHDLVPVKMRDANARGNLASFVWPKLSQEALVLASFFLSYRDLSQLTIPRETHHLTCPFLSFSF